MTTQLDGARDSFASLCTRWPAVGRLGSGRDSVTEPLNAQIGTPARVRLNHAKLTRMSTRFGRVQRFVVLLILGWTALDLGYPVLCALDREQSGSTYYAQELSEAPSSSNSETPKNPVHIDDCFCCSHCVTVTDVTPADRTVSTVRQENIAPLSPPLVCTFPVYHPPQFSL